jgi:hypothetical protein
MAQRWRGHGKGQSIRVQTRGEARTHAKQAGCPISDWDQLPFAWRETSDEPAIGATTWPTRLLPLSKRAFYSAAPSVRSPAIQLRN